MQGLRLGKDLVPVHSFIEFNLPFPSRFPLSFSLIHFLDKMDRLAARRIYIPNILQKFLLEDPTIQLLEVHEFPRFVQVVLIVSAEKKYLRFVDPEDVIEPEKFAAKDLSISKKEMSESNEVALCWNGECYVGCGCECIFDRGYIPLTFTEDKIAEDPRRCQGSLRCSWGCQDKAIRIKDLVESEYYVKLFVKEDDHEEQVAGREASESSDTSESS